jgi:hypothetical protein
MSVTTTASSPGATWTGRRTYRSGVSLAKLDLRPGAPVKKLTIQNGEVPPGEVADQFKPAEPFKFLPATPN